MLINGFEFLLRGGWIMYPLFVLAVVSVTVMLERSFFLKSVSVDTEKLMDEVKKLVVADKVGSAIELCERTKGPVAALLANGLRNEHLSTAGIERAMEELALRETPVLYKRLGILDTVITMAPLLGLLGTITGMIKAFSVVAGPDAATQAGAITGGVGGALIATATGLAIAVTTLPVYNYLSERVKEIISEMETRATQLLNIFANRQDERERAAGHLNGAHVDGATSAKATPRAATPAGSK